MVQNGRDKYVYVTSCKLWLGSKGRLKYGAKLLLPVYPEPVGLGMTSQHTTLPFTISIIGVYRKSLINAMTRSGETYELLKMSRDAFPPRRSVSPDELN